MCVCVSFMFLSRFHTLCLPVQRLLQLKFVFLNPLCNEIVIFDAKYFTPEVNTIEFVVVLKNAERCLKTRFLFWTENNATSADIICRNV